MKLNWGTSIVIAFSLFIAFILYFVIKVQSDSKYDNELVVEEYYKQELTFEKQMQKEQNAVNLEGKITFVNSKEGVTITFPNDFNFAKIEGKVSLYRPSNKKLDAEIPISLSSSHLLIPNNKLVGGRWDILIDWKYEGKEYLTKESIYY